MLHYGYPGRPFGALPDRRIQEKHIEGFFHYFRGYRLREILHTVYGETWLGWMRAAGMRLRSDYGDYFRTHPGERPVSGVTPYLIGTSREEAAENEGARLFPAFLYEPARFAFTVREQELLRGALAGETDEELSASLCLSVSAVKKRWATIYDRVEAVAPELLSGVSEASGEGRRGGERRRHLLNYLRDHPEELQPVSSSG